MANLRIRATQVAPRGPPQPPADEPGGVLALYEFFVAMMMRIINGILAEESPTEALGLDTTGPIVARAHLTAYNILLRTHSIGMGALAIEDCSDTDKAILHVLWLGKAVPLALRHAHRYVQHVVFDAPDDPDFSVALSDGHHMVCKVFLALLDEAIGAAIADPRFTARYEELYEDGDDIPHAGHYQRVFLHAAGTLQMFQLTFQQPSNARN